MRIVFMHMHAVLYCSELCGYPVYCITPRLYKGLSWEIFFFFFQKSNVTIIHLKIAICNKIGVQKFISLSLFAAYSHGADFHLYFFR